MKSKHSAIDKHGDVPSHGEYRSHGDRPSRAVRWAGLLAAGSLLLPGLSLAGHGGRHGAGGYDDVHYAEVVAVQPLYETVSYSVPQEQCRLEQVAYRDSYPSHRRQRSVAGPLVGAVIGGALGNAVTNRKGNRQAGMAVGAVLGATIGAGVQRRHGERYHAGPVQYRTEEVCETVTEFRQREELVGYDVTYRYGEQTYSTTLDQDPGPRLAVRVAVTPLG